MVANKLELSVILTVKLLLISNKLVANKFELLLTLTVKLLLVS